MTKIPSLSELDKYSVLDIRKAAQIAGISPSTLKRRGQAGELKITRLSIRRIGVRADHLRTWLDERAA